MLLLGRAYPADMRHFAAPSVRGRNTFCFCFCFCWLVHLEEVGQCTPRLCVSRVHASCCRSGSQGVAVPSASAGWCDGHLGVLLR